MRYRQNTKGDILCGPPVKMIIYEKNCLIKDTPLT